MKHKIQSTLYTTENKYKYKMKKKDSSLRIRSKISCDSNFILRILYSVY